MKRVADYQQFISGNSATTDTLPVGTDGVDLRYYTDKLHYVNGR